MTDIQKLLPVEAKQLLDSIPQAQLIDVRTTMEFSFVGHPVGAIHIPLKEYPDWQSLPDFVDRVRGAVPKLDTPLVLMCRSGVRSLEAAKLLQQAGYQHLYNMEEGFEGDKDANNHRGNLGGWRFHNLPWQQS